MFKDSSSLSKTVKLVKQTISQLIKKKKKIEIDRLYTVDVKTTVHFESQQNEGQLPFLHLPRRAEIHVNHNPTVSLQFI